MTETPVAEDAPEKARTSGAYLPKLPAGWHYSLALVGPDSQRIDLTPDPDSGVDGGYLMEVETGTGALTAVKADSLQEAAKMGVKAVKALSVVRTHRAAAAQAEEQFRAAIGRPSPQGEDGKLVTPKFNLGALLPPGATGINNTSGKPEPLTATEVDDRTAPDR